MRKIFILTTVLFVSAFLFADSLGIKSGDIISMCTLDGDDVSSITKEATIIRSQILSEAGRENSFTVAISSFLEYPPELKNLEPEERLLRIFNILTSFSTQKGITYISRTAGYKPKVLFEDSYSISDPAKKKSRIPDPVLLSVPGQARYFVYQKDNRFGGNTFAVDYLTTKDEIFMRIVNCTPMKFMGITCMEAGELSMYIDVMCLDDGLYLTGFATVENHGSTVNLVVYTVDLRSSFERRITALKDWFFKSVQELE